MLEYYEGNLYCVIWCVITIFTLIVNVAFKFLAFLAYDKDQSVCAIQSQFPFPSMLTFQKLSVMPWIIN